MAGGFQEWHLWMNTNVKEDIAYCRGLAETHPWIKVIEVPNITCVSNLNIHKFFKFACDEDAVYCRLDDDVVFLEHGFFDKIFAFREEHSEPFLVYGNIINNAIISHIHQRNRRFSYHTLGGYTCMDPIGWNDPMYAENVHRAFIQDVKGGNLSKWHSSFNVWDLCSYERVSINCISWLGKTFKEFDGVVGEDEEHWLSVDKPHMLGKPNIIYGGAIAAHFSFYTQRNHLDNTDILDLYKGLV